MNAFREKELRQELRDAAHSMNMLFIPALCGESLAIFLKVAGEHGPANVFMAVALIPAAFAGVEFVSGQRIDAELKGAKKIK